MANSSNKQTLLSQVMEEAKKNAIGDTYTLPISDIVMMQMVGNFDEFLTNLGKSPDSEEARRKVKDMVEEARSLTTAQKLFPEIVRKTVEAQVGDRMAAFRELGQNAIDSYEPNDREREVLFDVKNNDGNSVVRIRDFGEGMTLDGLVRDLLVPYNSGKEEDPTKIGEHGIGWYSSVDLADFVKVTTRKKGSSVASQAIVFKEGGNWVATLVPHSKDGFSQDMHKKPNGTEVGVFIDPDKIPDHVREDDFTDSIYQYLGMVDRSDAEIIVGGQTINQNRALYRMGPEVRFKHNGQNLGLGTGFSKRNLDAQLSDVRLRSRNRNLNKVLFTQRGLFVKYASNPFDEETLHHKLLEDMLGMGMDLWFEVPKGVTLTKGRNDIIADDYPPVLDTMYEGFENLFLNVVLDDEEVLAKNSNALMTSISTAFDKHFKERVKYCEYDKYPIGKRTLAHAAKIGSRVIDIGAAVAGTLGDAAATVIKYPFSGQVGKDLEEILKTIKEAGPEVVREVGKLVFSAAACVGTAYGAHWAGTKLYQNYGLKPLAYTGAAIVAGVAAYGAGKVARDAKKILGEYIDNKKKNSHNTGWVLRREIALGLAGETCKIAGSIPGRVYGTVRDLTSNTTEFFSRVSMGVLNRCGLYLDVEAKRERKREKKIKRVTKKYLVSLHEDSFLTRIMNKKVIPAVYYVSTHGTQLNFAFVDERKTKTISEVFWDYISPKEEDWHFNSRRSDRDLEERPTKISIEDLVQLFLAGKIKNSGTSFGRGPLKHGDYEVPRDHPLVSKVLGEMDKIKHSAISEYSVKVLEDRIDSVCKFAKEALVLGYFVSGVGVAHAAISSALGGQGSMFEESSVYNFMRDNLSRARAGIKSLGKKEVGRKILSGTAHVGGAVLKGLGKAGGGICRVVNPVRYPSYVVSLCSSTKKFTLGVADAYARRRERKIEEKGTIGERLGKRVKSVERLAVNGAIISWRYATNLYRSSSLYDLFGYGVRSFTGSYFDNFDLNKAEELVTRSEGVGRSYLDFLRVNSRFNEIVSLASGMTPNKVVLGARLAPKKRICSDMLMDKKGRYHVDLNSWPLRLLVQNADSSYDESERGLLGIDGFQDEQRNIVFAHRMLDLAIHQKAHELDHLRMNNSERKVALDAGGTHEGVFYKIKTKVREDTLAYLIRNGIDVVDEVKKYVVTAPGEMRSYHHVDLEIFKDLAVSSRRKVVDESAKYRRACGYFLPLAEGYVTEANRGSGEWPTIAHYEGSRANVIREILKTEAKLSYQPPEESPEVASSVGKPQ